MFLVRLTLPAALLIAGAVPALAMSHARRGPTSPKFFTHKGKGSSLRVSAHHGGTTAGHAAAFHPTQIDPARATQIQAALIKSGYLTGEPTGRWDADTQAALRKMQGDNGWQTKITPDSRAIIKLGLGPATIHSDEAANTPSTLSGTD